MIIACGEALIDMLPRTSTLGEPAFAPHAGGAVFNTAVALGRLGAKPGFFSGISTDMMGAILTARLDESGVDHSFCARSARPTTLALVELRDGQASYAFYDENTAGRMLTPADLPPEGAAQAWFFGGISLVAEPCGTAYEALQARESARAVTMLDPNIRPGFIRDEAAYRARITRMIARADIVKLSDEDLHWIAGPGDVAERAHEMLALGPALVCVTEGAQGARGFTTRGEARATAPAVAVVDTVGAGDTFNAGLLAALDDAGCLTKAALAALDMTTLTTALALGTRAAAVTVSRAGANPPWRHEL
ncbi:MAG: carbohydrate kinase [Rubellimicrobium sp.]|nr:carbohydrate kinase [Rubellimicrobium sp.]